MSRLDLTRAPATDPTFIYRQRDGLYGVDLLTAAVARLDFFTWLARNPSTLAGICTGCGFQERPTDVMLTLFTAMGLVERRAGKFQVSASAAEHLVGGSPFNLAPYYASLKERPIAKDYESVLRTGKTANWSGLKDEKAWAQAMETEPFASQFTAAMDCRGFYLGPAMAKALDLKGFTKLLDIGGGSGIYSCALTANHPHLKATVLDKSPVDKLARRNVAERGYSDRVEVVAGDMFIAVNLPTDCDLHLYSNVLHDWDFAEVRKLLENSFAALKPGGMLIVHDAHINEDKSGPLPVAQYSALLMHSTEGKCYSLGEMRELLTEAGFTDMQYQPTAADRSIITVRKTGKP
ncbi:MAG: methyltransferase [Verrucomicrobiota bacterium]